MSTSPQEHSSTRLPVHAACGGAIHEDRSGGETYHHCERCGAYAFWADPAAIPSGTDPAANRAAWDAGGASSPA